MKIGILATGITPDEQDAVADAVDDALKNLI